MLLAFSLVMAANENANQNAGKSENKTLNETENKNVSEKPENKTLNYGQCVTAGVDIKNTCYRAAKDKQDSCKQVAANATSKKAETTKCRNTYNQEMKHCKTDFKAAKTECARLTKPDFFEKLKYAFK